MATQDILDARVDFEREHRTPDDLELEPVTSEDEDYVSAPANYLISTYPADFTLEVLHQKWRDGDFRIPEFQRAFVWKQAQASRLIESFLVGLPVPPVYLYQELESQYFLVLDGQQRLKSIFYFFEGYFPEDSQGQKSVFRLTGLGPESHFQNRTFDRLYGWHQERLKNAVLRCFVVRQIDSNDHTSMYHIFERLNTGGTLLTNQEIRNCVYDGKFAKYLRKLNELPEWRKILGKDAPDSRKKDIELLVRFFAMRDISAYRRPMKDFLSAFMRKNRDASAESLAESGRVFKDTCSQLLEALGEKPFHIRSGLNTAVYDSVMVAFSKRLDAVPPDIESRYKRLLQDERFIGNTIAGTTRENTVRERFAKAKSVLFG